MLKKLALIIFALAVLAGGYTVLSTPEPVQESMQIQELNPVKEAAISETENRYVPYSETAVAEAGSRGRTLLFFHASWCPTCKAAEKDILKNSSKLPEDLTIIKTDYDKQTELKKKYGLTYQHTFVQVDEKGEMITKWSGGGAATILQNLEN